MENSSLDNSSTATLFISFDLVNCTEYKSRHVGTWAGGVSAVIRRIIKIFMAKESDGYRFWKVLGDEVIFTKNIPFTYEIGDILDEVYAEVVAINKLIKSAEIGDDNTAKFLSVKAAVWIANISSSSMSADNVYTEYKINDDKLQAEYIGTDIDAGFRIAKYTSSNRVVISFEVAAFFVKNRFLKRNLQKINFIGLRSLKGIWSDKPYPIFMYHADEDVSFHDSVVQNPDTRSEILEQYLEDMPKYVHSPEYVSYEEQLISKYCENENLQNKIEQFFEIITDQCAYPSAAPTEQFRVHYSVLCYAQDEGETRFMLTVDKSDNMGFGGVIMHHNLQFLDTMNQYYIDEFGVELDFVKDSRYHDPIPLILSTYTAIDGVPGTIFLAKIASEKLWGDLSEKFSAQLYECSEAPDFNFYDCEKSAKELMKKALEYI